MKHSQILKISFLVLVLISLLKLQLILNNTVTGILGFGMLILVSYFTLETVKSSRFLIPTILVLTCTFFIPGNTIFFILFSLTFILVVEISIGKTSILALLTTLFMSSIFVYVSNIYTFTIRLTISEIASYILKLLFENVELQGTIFILNKTQILSVESACMGLGMLNIGMLMTVFLMAFYQNKFKKKISTYWILGLILISFILIIINNIIRIIALAIFDFKEDNPLHEGLGLACLIIYVLLPLTYFIPLIYNKLGKTSLEPNIQKPINEKISYLTIAFSIMLFLVNYKNLTSNTLKGDLGFGVKRIELSNGVLYKKPIPHFYSAEHSPMFCWRGEGYTLVNIEIKNWHGQDYYFGKLEKKGTILYTAWWFSDQKTRTIDQKKWRWEALVQKKDFNLINITATSENDLLGYIGKYYTKL
jgi:exosortase N